MKRLLALVMLFGLAFSAVTAQAVEVKMAGDARIYANWWDHYNFTGWDPTGHKTYDSLTIWERFRLRTDFIANEGLKFRLGIRVDDTPWGSDTFTVDNPTADIQVYQAYLQFKWPSTDIEFTVGLQDLDLPMSVDWLGANPVFGGTGAAAAVVNVPVTDQFSILAGFARFLDSNKDFDPTTTQVSDELDGYFLILPITLEGFKITPWGLVGVAGREADYSTFVGNGPNASERLTSYLLSAGNLTGAGWKHNQNMYWWIGGSVAVTKLDPFKFYGDIIYGEGNFNDRKKNYRHGWWFDVAAEYTGFDAVTPQITFWYGSGEDKSMNNGSERMPSVVDSWGPSNSFLFNTNQEFNYGYVPVNSTGSWGFVFALDKISFLKGLTHRIDFSAAWGTNAPQALRCANQLAGVGNYVQMGRDLTWNETVFGVGFDSTYAIYDNLAFILETGWAHGNFQRSVWGRRFVHAAENGDAWKAAFGVKYTF